MPKHTVNHGERNPPRKGLLDSQNLSYISISQVKITVAICFLKVQQMHLFQILFTCKIPYDIICISVHRICGVNVIAYSVKVEDTFVQLSNMRAELRFVYSRHQMDVWDKEQKNTVPRGACNAPFQMPKVLACERRSCTNHWFPFLKVLNQEAFFCSRA